MRTQQNVLGTGLWHVFEMWGTADDPKDVAQKAQQMWLRFLHRLHGPPTAPDAVLLMYA